MSQFGLLISGVVILLLIPKVWGMNVFYMWVMLEVISLLVVIFSVLMSEGVKNFSGIVVYFLMQSFGSVVILIILGMEMSLAGNNFFFGSPFYSFSKLVSSLGLICKLSIFPFYLQVVNIFMLLSYKQCFLLSYYPKVLPYLFLIGFLDDTNIMVVVLVSLFSFVVSSCKSLLSVDFRELMSWSTVNQSSWMLMSVLLSVKVFLFIFLVYSILNYVMWIKLSGSESNYFISKAQSMSFSSGQMYVMVLIVSMVSFAPLFFFLAKLYLLVNLLELMSGFLLGLMLVSMLSSFVFYVRMIQFILNVNSNYSFNRVIVVGSIQGEIKMELIVSVMMMSMVFVFLI